MVDQTWGKFENNGAIIDTVTTDTKTDKLIHDFILEIEICQISRNIKENCPTNSGWRHYRDCITMFLWCRVRNRVCEVGLSVWLAGWLAVWLVAAGWIGKNIYIITFTNKHEIYIDDSMSFRCRSPTPCPLPALDPHERWEKNSGDFPSQAEMFERFRKGGFMAKTLSH